MGLGLKSSTKTRDLKPGHFIVEFVSPSIGHIVKAASCDFVPLDMKHSGFGFETVKSAIRYFEATDVRVILRVPSQDYQMQARGRDVGAEVMLHEIDEETFVTVTKRYDFLDTDMWLGCEILAN